MISLSTVRLIEWFCKLRLTRDQLSTLTFPEVRVSIVDGEDQAGLTVHALQQTRARSQHHRVVGARAVASTSVRRAAS